MVYKLVSPGDIQPVNLGVELLFTKYLPKNTLLVLDSIHNSSALQIPDYIKHTVFEWSSNPVDIEQRWPEVALESCTVLTGLFKYFKNPLPYHNTKFFPFWALWTSYQYANQYCNHAKTHSVSCLNGTTWDHRKFVYLNLANKNYFDQIIFSYGHRPIQDHNQYSNNGVNLRLTTEELQDLSQLPQRITYYDDGPVDIFELTHPAYTSAYVNLVTETTIRADTPMLSEKTFKPIAAGQLFVLVASPGSIQFLRDIGIDTFDDIIDHSYDNVIDARARLLAALTQVDYLMTLNLEQIFPSIQTRLQRNATFFTSDEFRKQFSLSI